MGVLACPLTRSMEWAAAYPSAIGWPDSATMRCLVKLEKQLFWLNSVIYWRKKLNTGHWGHPDKLIQHQDKITRFRTRLLYTGHLATLISPPVLGWGCPCHVRSSEVRNAWLKRRCSTRPVWPLAIVFRSIWGCALRRPQQPEEYPKCRWSKTTSCQGADRGCQTAQNH